MQEDSGVKEGVGSKQRRWAMRTARAGYGARLRTSPCFHCARTKQSQIQPSGGEGERAKKQQRRQMRGEGFFAFTGHVLTHTAHDFSPPACLLPEPTSSIFPGIRVFHGSLGNEKMESKILTPFSLVWEI